MCCLCAPASSSLVASLKCPILNLSFIHWCWGLIRAGWVNHTNPVLLWWIHFHLSNWIRTSLAEVSFTCWNCVGNTLNCLLEGLSSPHAETNQPQPGLDWWKTRSRCGAWPLFERESPGYVSQSRYIYNCWVVVTVWIFEVVPQTQGRRVFEPTQSSVRLSPRDAIHPFVLSHGDAG